MADPDTASIPPEKTESRADADPKPESSKFWLGEITAAGKRDDNWIKRARKVVNRYRDERDHDSGSVAGEKRANILWSNTELLKSALFQGLGNPDVRRRFPKRGKDEKNTKQAALVMERGATYTNDAYDCESQIEAAVEDMVLPGRGVCWVVYDAVVKDGEIKYQSVKDEHVFWEDYRTSAGRKESDIWWKARRHYYARDDLITYFGEKHGKVIPLNAQVADSTADRKKDADDTFKRSSVWEVWDKNKRERIYIAEDYQWVVKRDPDPYGVTEFYPCPDTLYGCKTTSSLTPIPEFTLYQDQADELDVIATRLSFLIEALKRRGVYDSSMEGSDGQLSQLALAGDNQFLPFKGFAGLMEKGGLKAVFQTEDLAPIVAAIEGLYKRAAFLVNSIYEVTGIADIMRGASDPNETATAQKIKGQFGSMRLQKRQRRVQRFIRDLVRIKTEIIAEHFTREQLQEMVGLDMPLAAEKQAAQQKLAMFQQQAQMAAQAAQMAQSGQAPPGAQNGAGGPPGAPQMGHNGGPPMMGGMMPPPQPPDPAMIQELQDLIKLPTWEEVSAILRSDQRRGYKVDVETDQTAQIDEQEEKNSRIEFMSTITTLMEKAIPMAMQMPAMRPLIKESIQFVVKAFKAGRPLEEAFEDAFAQLEKMPPPQGGGDPVAEAKAAQIQQDMQISVQEAQANAQKSAADIQAKQQQTQADAAKSSLDVQAAQQDAQTKAADAEAERAIKLKQAHVDMVRQAEKDEMDRQMAFHNADLTKTMDHLDAQEAIDGILAGRREQAMAVAEHKQKMAHAERKANQPTAQSGAQ